MEQKLDILSLLRLETQGEDLNVNKETVIINAPRVLQTLHKPSKEAK